VRIDVLSNFDLFHFFDLLDLAAKILVGEELKM